MPRTLTTALFVLSLFGAAVRAGPVGKADVDAVVRPLIEDRWCAGVTVGLIDEKGARVFGYGRATDGDDRTPDGRTVYEIGSVTKTFTSLLLAEMVTEGKVALDDPVSRFLPSGALPPTSGPATAPATGPASRPAEPVTLLHLATHTSGLPRLPDNLHPKDPANPYADYTVEQLYAFLSRCDLSRAAPAGRFEYSNLGVGLLGHVLSLKAGEPYEALLVRRVCDPLGMADTRITLDEGLRKRLAAGHDVDGSPAANWDLPVLAGAGAIRSTADDLLKYLAAQMAREGEKPTSGSAGTPAGPAGGDATLARAVAFTHVARADATGLPDSRIALGWLVDTRRGVYWHNGQTGGYHCYVAFHPGRGVGVAVLTNTASGAGDAVGRDLIGRALGEPPAPLNLPAVAKLDAKALDACVGDYLMGMGVLTVTREGDRLYAQLTGQPRAGIYPTSEREFFWKVAPARLTFQAGSDGKANRLVLHQNGTDIPGPRIGPGQPAGR